MSKWFEIKIFLIFKQLFLSSFNSVVNGTIISTYDICKTKNEQIVNNDDFKRKPSVEFNFEMNLTFTQALPFGFDDSIVVSVLKLFLQKNN